MATPTNLTMSEVRQDMTELESEDEKSWFTDVRDMIVDD